MKNFTLVEKVGIWSVSCVQHGFIEAANSPFVERNTYRVPAATGSTIVQALESFRRGDKRLWIDQVSWPMNAGCSGIKNGVNLMTQ